jgi:hypothetical protein
MEVKAAAMLPVYEITSKAVLNCIAVFPQNEEKL